MINLEQYLYERKSFINNQLNKLMPLASTFPSIIHEAMRYSIFAGGKRLRPILTMASAETFGCSYKNASVYKTACAIELIHTYTLVHDDLPAIDNDDYRRGNLTCHKKYDEATAILAGDALLTFAFEILSSIKIEENDSNITPFKNIYYIAKCIGSQGVIGGQVIDIMSEDKIIDEETLKYIHSNKTAELFKAAIVSGGVLGGCDQRELTALENFAYYFGLAFQISDDILDIEGSTAEIGKNTGSDLKNKKATYPSLYGMEKSKDLAQKSILNAVETLETLGNKADILKAITSYTIARSG